MKWAMKFLSKKVIENLQICTIKNLITTITFKNF